MYTATERFWMIAVFDEEMVLDLQYARELVGHTTLGIARLMTPELTLAAFEYVGGVYVTFSCSKLPSLVGERRKRMLDTKSPSGS